MTSRILMPRAPFTFICAILIAWPASAFAQDGAAKDSARPPAASVTSKNGVVAADNIEASRVGAAILSAGCNAADAGAATLLANGVLNPFASRFVGRGFCLYRPIDTGKTHLFYIRSPSPLNTTAYMYLK